MKKFLSFFLIFVLISLVLISSFSCAAVSLSSSDYSLVLESSDDGIISKLSEIWQNIVDTYNLLVNIRDRILDSVASSITNGFRGLWSYLDTIISDISFIRNSIVNGLWNYLDNLDDKLNSVKSMLTNSIPYEISTGFSGVTSYLKDTYEKLNSLVSVITNHLTDSFVNSLLQAKEYLSDIYNKVHDLYNVITLGIEVKLNEIRIGFINLPENISNSISSVGDKLTQGFKDIFFIDEDELEETFLDTVNQLGSELGISAISSVSLFSNEGTSVTDSAISDAPSEVNQILDVFSIEKEPGNVTSEYFISGLGKFNFTFVNYRYLIKGVEFFRPYIRGFLYMLLVIFNVNQILTLINQTAVFGKEDSKFIFKLVKDE